MYSPKSIFALLFLFNFNLCLKAQNDNYSWKPDNSITIIKDGEILVNPWAGGMDATSLHKVDFDLDGDDDLIVFDDADNSIEVFEWTVDNKWVHVSANPYKDTKVLNFVFIEDFNEDGVKDLITNDNFKISCYLGNINNGLLEFASESYFINSTVGNIVADETPAFFDSDSDGDIDFIHFDPTGQFINFFENISSEFSTNPDSLFFNLSDECWGKFQYRFDNDSLIFNSDCNSKLDYSDLIEEKLHIVPSIFVKDLNDDGKVDLLMSDSRFEGFKVLLNEGIENVAFFSSFSEGFPFDEPAEINSRPLPNFIDADNDGDEDLVVTKQYENFSNEPFEIAWLYDNNEGEYNLVQQDFLVNTMFDIGRYSKPVMYDYNKDGLIDILVINNFRNQETNQNDFYLSILRNNSSEETPSFELVTNELFDFSGIADSNFDLTFGDFDADGDDDIVIGAISGKFHYFLNENNDYTYLGHLLGEDGSFELDFGSASSPVSFDYNNDGASDIIFGRSSGTVGLLTNIGLNESNIPEFEITNEYISNINVQVPGTSSGNSTITIEYLNDTLNFYVGSVDGKLYFYENIDVLSSNTLLPTDTLNFRSKATKPAFFTHNNIKYIVVGNSKGGLNLMKYTIEENVQYVGTHEVGAQSELVFYPNPFNDHLIIESSKVQNSQLIFLNSIGQIIDILPFETKGEIILDTSYLPSGLYYIVNQLDNNLFHTHKIFKSKNKQ